MDKKIISERLDEKIEEIEKYLEEFSTFEIPEFEEYSEAIGLKAICERYFEKIIEAIISATLLLIRYKNFKQPENEEHAFVILSNNGIISKEFAKKLKDAKNMRNIIIHNYLKVEDVIVYNAVTEEIITDAEEFLNSVKTALQ